jgi:outer membrane protein assembly factor BamE
MIIISLMYVKNILIHFKRLAALLAVIAPLTACELGLIEPHQIDIEQGNAISQEEFESLYTGMTQAEVLEAVGAPLMKDSFHPDRWDYVYRLKPGKGRVRESRFTLYFRDEILVKIDGGEYKEY